MAKIPQYFTLTPKQAAWVEEYPKDMDHKKAAERAGYSMNSAAQAGLANLKNPKVMECARRAMRAREARTNITQDRVLVELARIAFADLRDLFTWNEELTQFVPSRQLTDDQAAAISSIKSRVTKVFPQNGDPRTYLDLEIKTYDKLGALQLLAKHLGMVDDRLTGEVDVTHRFENMSNEDLMKRATELVSRIPKEVREAAMAGSFLGKGNGGKRGNGKPTG